MWTTDFFSVHTHLLIVIKKKNVSHCAGNAQCLDIVFKMFLRLFLHGYEIIIISQFRF